MRIQNLINKVVTAISLFLVFSITACSTTHKAVDSRSTVIPKNLYAKPVKKKPEEGALWPGNTRGNFLFGDDKAAKIGDIITVTINENATSTQSATTNTAKDTSINMQAPNVLGLPSNLGIQNFLNMGTQFDPSVNASIANSMQGTGTVTRNGTLTATISAIITDIVPSGNLRIEGRRSVTVNNEEQIMILRGVVRPQDINFDNTISSTLIADAAISYTGEGVVADEQRKGWLARVFSKVWPF
jgi:flagellar L-ring protein FlgH